MIAPGSAGSLSAIAHQVVSAAAFKQVVHHCQQHITVDAFTTALILSDNAYKTVFDGGYTRVIGRNEFAPLLITNNEFSEHSWVRITGVHPAQISSIPLTDEPAPISPDESAPTPGNAPSTRSISNSGPVRGSQVTGDGNTFYTTPNLNVSNYVGGRNTGVQTGTFNGNLNQAEER